VQFSIVGRNVEITDAIRDYVEKRLMKLKKYFSRVVDVHVVLFTQKINQVAEVTINAGGIAIHGEESSEDLYASIDKVVDKLSVQLRKHKERLKEHHKKEPRPDKDLNLNVSIYEKEEVEEAKESPQVMHTQRFAIKPMSVDEAVMQLDLINNDFLVYMNSLSNKVNVLYRRNDGNYGLIEPEY
jgi:putative sigma-54 modulation protein